MAETTTLKVEYFTSGYCVAHANIADPKNGRGKTRFYAVWALIQHPDLGFILFDTGYSQFFQEATQKFPARFYRWATPVCLKKHETAKAILQKKGINPESINYVIISHFHADHVAGLKDFPAAKFICTQIAYQQMMKLNGLKAVCRGILKDLIPQNIHDRVLFVEDIANIIEDKSGLIFYNLFNKNIFKLVLLPGHARGMLGFLANNQLFATDASWSLETFVNGILPNKIVKLFFDSWVDFLDTQEKLKTFLKQNHTIKIFFTHCPKTLKLIETDV